MNWSIHVAEADNIMTHPALCKIEQLRDECEVRFQRRSGPGGQHRNKVETAVILIHTPTGVKAEANERRSQAENLKVAMRRMRVNLALEFRSKTVPDEPENESRKILTPSHEASRDYCVLATTIFWRERTNTKEQESNYQPRLVGNKHYLLLVN